MGDEVMIELLELPDWAVAGFAAGVINDHLRDDGDPTNDGCCPDCCAPCGALRWLRDNRRDELDDAIVAHLGMSWDWQNVDRVDWDSLAGRWGCQSKPTCDEQDIADADAAMADPAPHVSMDEVLARYRDEETAGG